MQTAKILVADDEQNLRRVLAALLRREGHEVVQAASGLEAIDHLADVDVVITDLRMPGADGMEVLRTATRNHPHVPVIMITAYGSVGQAVEAIKAGAFDYIEKPFEQDSIRAIVEKAIGQAAESVIRTKPLVRQAGNGRSLTRPSPRSRRWGGSGSTLASGRTCGADTGRGSASGNGVTGRSSRTS